MRAALSSLSIALSALGAAKLRTSLTALGILIGIAAVVVVAALGTGARERIGGQIESLGSNLLFIWAQPADPERRGRHAGAPFGLTDDDAETIRRESTAIADVAAYSEVKPQVMSEFGNEKLGVIGRRCAVLRGAKLRGPARAGGWTEHGGALQGQGLRDRPDRADEAVRQRRSGRPLRPHRPASVPDHRHARSPRATRRFEDQDDRVLMPIGSFRARVAPTLGRRVQL